MPVRAAILAGRLALVAGIGVTTPARALSEIQSEDVPGAPVNPPDRTSDTPIEKQPLPPVGTVPIPDSTTIRRLAYRPSRDPTAVPDEEAPEDEGRPARRSRSRPRRADPGGRLRPPSCRNRSGVCTA